MLVIARTVILPVKSKKCSVSQIKDGMKINHCNRKPIPRQMNKTGKPPLCKPPWEQAKAAKLAIQTAIILVTWAENPGFIFHPRL